MSTIDPSTIDPTKPAQGLPLTANVRANESATQDNFTAAKSDIEALEATAPTTDEKAALDGSPTPATGANPYATIADAGGAVDVLTSVGDLLTRDGAGYQRQPAGPDGYLVSYSIAAGTGLEAIDPATVGTTVHADLQGLTGSDDHTQYLNDSRGDARYYTQVISDARYTPIGHVGAAGTGVHGPATGVQDGFMSAADFSKLAALSTTPGDMLKSEYDADDNGIVTYANSSAAIGSNSTGVTILKGRYVQGQVGGAISLAEPLSGQWAIGVAAEDIANGSSGTVILQGAIFDVHTGAGATSDAIYLDALGTWTTSPPTDRDHQRLGTIWESHATTGSIIVDIDSVTVPEPEGSTGLLVKTEISGPVAHSNASLVAWTEVVLAGDTIVTQSVNMVAGNNAGRLQFDYSGSTAPLPPIASIAGLVTIQLSLEFPTINDVIEIGPMRNGVIIAAEISAFASAPTTTAAVPVTIAVPISGWSDGDELSIATRGEVGTYTIHSMSLSFMATEGAGGGGGGGGVDTHVDLLGRSANDQHPQSAITGLVTDLAAKADQTSLDAHISDATAAHAASAVSVVSTGGLAATDVQGALAELDADLAAHVGAGGAAHALAVPGGAAGFLSGADKDKLDTFAPGYDLAQNDGSNLPAQTTLNAGPGILAADNAGATRTDLSIVAGTAIVTDIDGVSVDLGTAGTQAAFGNHVHAEVIAAGASGFMSGTDKTKLDGIDSGANAYVFPGLTGDVTSTGEGANSIAPGAVTNSNLAAMAAYTIKVRDSATPGDPQDEQINQIANVIATPGAGDLLLAESAGGVLSRIDVGDLPGGGGAGDMLAPVAAVTTGELYVTTDTTGEQTAGAGFGAAIVARTDIANTFVDVQEFSAATAMTGGVLHIERAGTPIVTLENLSGTANQRAVMLDVQNSALQIQAVSDGPVYAPGATAINVDLTDGIVSFIAGPPTFLSGQIAVGRTANLPSGNLLQGATGNKAADTGIATVDMVRRDVTTTIETGITQPATQVASAASVTFDPTVRNSFELTGSAATEVQALSVEASIIVSVPDTVTLTFAAGVIVTGGTQAGTGNSAFSLFRIGTTTYATWCS